MTVELGGIVETYGTRMTCACRKDVHDEGNGVKNGR